MVEGSLRNSELEALPLFPEDCEGDVFQRTP